jgi:hypothetical protein
VLLAAAAAVAFATVGAGCGGGSGHGGGKPTPAPSASLPGAQIPTGTQLQALLPYHQNQPAGWQLTSVRSSGSTLQQPIGLGSFSSDCSYVAIPSSALSVVTNWWAVSWAYSLMSQHSPGPNGPDTNHDLTLVLGAFQPGYAQKQINWYGTDAVRCHVYTDKFGKSWTTTSSVVPGLGDQALYIQNVSSVYTQQELMVRTGNNMAALSQDSAFGPIMAPAQLEAVAQTLVQRLAAR